MIWTEMSLGGCLHVKFHTRTKSLISMVKCLLLFTRFCRDEISSRDEILSPYEKKTCKHFIPGWNYKMSMFFFYFWRIYSNMLSQVNMFEHNHNESMSIMKDVLFTKSEVQKEKGWAQQENIKILKTCLLFPLFSLWSLEKIEISFCFNLLPYNYIYRTDCKKLGTYFKFDCCT